MQALLLLAALSAAQQTSARAQLEAVAQVPESEDADGDFKLSPLTTPRLAQVDEGLWRSGQPSREGLEQLAKAGVKTVLSLRERVDEEERREAARLGMKVENVPILGFLMPTFSQVDRALAVLNDPAKRPVAVHCRHGKDRTGVVVAAYRVKKGLPVKQAAAEAKSFGCCIPGYRDLEKYLSDYQARN